MKKLLFTMFVALLMVGCGEDSEWVEPPEASQTPGTFMYGWMKEIFEEYKVDAEKGILNAQQNLVWHYENGEGVPRDYVAAYAWYLVSAEKAEIDLNDAWGLTKTPKQIIAEGKDLLAKKMTPEQITKGQELSKELLKKIEANKKADKREDSPESNASLVETPPAKTAEVAKVVVDWDQLELREGGWCFEGKPFTGVAVGKHPNGQKNSEATFKEGEQHGLETTWYSNGQKEYEAIFEDGKKDGLKTVWRKNGQKKEEATYKDGKLMTAVGLKPNGEKCPDTNLVNGNGIVCYYHKNGQKAAERTYKDGKLHGLFTRWYENGQKEGEFTVKDGGVISEKRWDENGNLVTD